MWCCRIRADRAAARTCGWPGSPVRRRVAGRMGRPPGRASGRWTSGVRLGEAGFGVLQVGLRRVVLPDRRERRGGVEAAGDESDCGGDDYGGACGGGVEPSGSFAVGCAEADGREEGEDDDEVGEVAQGLRQFQRGELRRAHQVDRDLAGDRVADGDDPQQADALLAEEGHGDYRGEREPAENHDGDRGCRPRRCGRPALPVPRAAGESRHDAVSDGAAQQVSRHREIAAPALLVDDDEVEDDPGGGQRERSDPELGSATPDGSECGCRRR